MNYLEILLWFSLGCIFYTYLGYGFILILLVNAKKMFSSFRQKKVPGRRNASEEIFEPAVTLMVAAYNEIDCIHDKVENSLQLNYPAEKLEVIFVTDGSTDGTNAALQKDNRTTVLHQDVRAGKIAAINRAMKYVKTPIVVFSDANTMLNKSAIRELVKHYKDANVGAVSGEKRVQSNEHDNAAASGEGLYWKYESFLKKMDAELYSVVGAAGELFSIRTELFEEVEPDVILDDFMISLQIAQKNYRVGYEPKAFALETASESVKDELTRRTRIAAGGFQAMSRLKGLLNLFKYRTLSFQYISHRVFRWAIAPVALFIALPLNIMLLAQGSIYTWLLFLQISFYVMALTGWHFENNKTRIKILFIPYYFFVTNLALINGFFKFTSGRQTVLWERANRRMENSNKALKEVSFSEKESWSPKTPTIKNALTTLTIALFLLFANSCSKNNPVSETGETSADEQKVQVGSNFNWATTREIDIKISALDNTGAPLSGVRFDIYDKDVAEDGKLLFSGATNAQGDFVSKARVPAYLENLHLKTNFVGLPSGMSTPISGNFVEFNLGGSVSRQNEQSGQALSKTVLTSPYKYLGSWDNHGVPDYLAPSDIIDADFLGDVNKTLPEQNPLSNSHPGYLAGGNQTNTVLLDEADVWVTFVHEGAGWGNSLAFYTYHIDSPPSSTQDLDSLTIIFPNLSYLGNGAGLQSGDKVLIGRFPKDTVVGWALITKGWKGNSVGDGAYIVYSDRTLNPESDSNLQQHNVLINDPGRNRVLLGFEDIRRDHLSCDQDFNDAIFYVTANPFSALETGNLPLVDYETSNDSDGDGIADNLDDYADDPALAFDNYYPGQNNFGTLVFEDLWPGIGDYDFNDLVVDYNFNQVTNANNDVVKINCLFSVRAIGAAYQNGFGFQMPTAPDNISQVTGISLSTGLINLAANNLEAGQNKAVVIVSDNVSELILRPGGYFVNTEVAAPYVQPDTIALVIEFNAPIAVNEIGLPPYNPFIYVNQERGKEVHLPNHLPTDLAETSLFGTSHDRTNPAAGDYYITEQSLPWALDIPINWQYPQEKIAISQAYLLFRGWAESDGLINLDWYKSLNGYREESSIYTK